MKGCKKLSKEEILMIKENLTQRDRCVFAIGIRAGFRIGEILSLRVCDVTDSENRIKQEIYLKKKATKGKLEGRVVPMHPEVVSELLNYIPKEKYGSIEPLFQLNKSTYWRSLKRACKLAGLPDDRISSHAARKTFAQSVYDITNGNIYKIQKAMGHKSINSTSQYIDVDMDEVWNAIKNSK